VSGLFFPLRLVLRIDGRGYSARVLEKLVTLGGDVKSFERAHFLAGTVAETSASAMQIRRLTHQIGRELTAARDQRAEQHRYRQLAPDSNQPPVDLACVEMDGGRINTRAGSSGRGVHEGAWRESKVACLWRMTGPKFEHDPHPELPRCFADRAAVPKLVREVKRLAGGGAENRSQKIRDATCDHVGPDPCSETDVGLGRAAARADEPAAAKTDAEASVKLDTQSNATLSAESSAPPDAERERWQPERLFRTCVASLRDVYGFGPLVAAEAQARGFYQAQRRVFLGDGDSKNWTVHRLHFPQFTGITDFMHVVGYVFCSATAIEPHQSWPLYLRHATACWQGRVNDVIGELDAWAAGHPLPADTKLGDIPDDDPRKIVHQTATYLKNNRERMDYPKYRMQGLPTTSSLVESLIKEFNLRVKGTEKYWSRASAASDENEPCTGVSDAESILQVRAALLCHDERLRRHIRSRPGCPFVRRTTAHTAKAA
jgi:hypothetical protein